MGEYVELVERILSGDVRSAARLMRALDDESPTAQEVLRALYRHAGQAKLIGITGNPGAGKSTVTDQLIRHYRGRGLRVAVVAVDPSSPFSGGAILGDRIRMQDHAGDSGVFIRSLATRGVLGGLTASTRNIITVFDAMGFDRIIVETVGVGQDEVDVVNTVHTSVVVSVPGLGDGVQMIKAGLMEIADIFVVNKADRPEADRVVRQIETLLELEGRVRHGWAVPVLSTVATDGQGIEALAQAVEGHAAHLQTSEEGERRVRRRLEAEVGDLIFRSLKKRVQLALNEGSGLEDALDELRERKSDPESVVQRILKSLD